jgi:hypothetical protein
MRAQTPSPKSVPLGTTTAERAGRSAFVGLRCSSRMMSCRNSSAVSAVWRSSGKLPCGDRRWRRAVVAHEGHSRIGHPPKWKLENGAQRPAPETRSSGPPT